MQYLRMANGYNLLRKHLELIRAGLCMPAQTRPSEWRPSSHISGLLFCVYVTAPESGSQALCASTCTLHLASLLIQAHWP